MRDRSPFAFSDSFVLRKWWLHMIVKSFVFSTLNTAILILLSSVVRYSKRALHLVWWNALYVVVYYILSWKFKMQVVYWDKALWLWFRANNLLIGRFIISKNTVSLEVPTWHVERLKTQYFQGFCVMAYLWKLRCTRWYAILLKQVPEVRILSGTPNKIR